MINLGVVTLLQHPDQLEALKKVGPWGMGVGFRMGVSEASM